MSELSVLEEEAARLKKLLVQKQDEYRFLQAHISEIQTKIRNERSYLRIIEDNRRILRTSAMVVSLEQYRAITAGLAVHRRRLEAESEALSTNTSQQSGVQATIDATYARLQVVIARQSAFGRVIPFPSPHVGGSEEATG